MYNEGIKNAFLQKAEQDGEEHLLKRKYVFEKTNPFENEIGKDIALFTKQEISNMYIRWDISLTSLYVTHSFLRKYASFYSKQNGTKCDILTMTQSEVKESYSKKEMENVEKNNFPVRDFINRIDALKNPADKFLLYGLFQGVRGVSNCELAYSTMEACNVNKRKIWLAGFECGDIVYQKRLYRADERLFNYAIESSKTYVYYTYEEDRQQEIELDSNRIIKIRHNINDETSESIEAGKVRIDNRLRILLNHMGLSNFSGLDIYKIGLAYHIKKICLEYGITDLLNVFKTEEYKAIKEQYNLTDNDRNVRRILKGFL